MGLTRREFTTATALRWLATAAVALVTAAVVLVLTSPIAPIGLARRTIDHSTIRVDGVVMVVTLVGVAVFVCSLASLAGWRAASRDRRERRVSSVRSVPSLGPSATTGIRATILGLRHPLRSNTGSAIGAIALVTMTAVAGVALVASYDRLVDQPARYGAPWDAIVGNNASVAEVNQVATALARVDGIGAAAGILDLDETFIGREKVPLISFLPVRGQAKTVGPEIIEGREPSGAGEVALGSVSMRRLGLSIGDHVKLLAPNTPLRPVPARVVGRAILNNTYGLEPGVGGVIDGGWAKRIAAKVGFEPVPQQLAVRVATDAERAAVLRDLQRTFPESYTPPVPSTSLRNLGRLRGLPWALIAMLLALAIGVTLHALVTGIRRRRPELAVLRALGFTARNTRSSLLWQATALSLTAAAIGLPLGIVLARIGWRAISSANGVEDSLVVSLGPTFLVVALAVAVPLVLAVVPAVRESHRHVASVLRVE